MVPAEKGNLHVVSRKDFSNALNLVIVTFYDCTLIFCQHVIVFRES